MLMQPMGSATITLQETDSNQKSYQVVFRGNGKSFTYTTNTLPAGQDAQDIERHLMTRVQTELRAYLDDDSNPRSFPDWMKEAFK